MAAFEGIKLVEIIADEVGTPRDDGTPGSALYTVPIRLSAVAPRAWADIFVRVWNHPPQFTTMHRPGIATVDRDRVILNGTTLEEIDRYHRSTLMVVVDETNRRYLEYVQKRDQETSRERERVLRHHEEVKKRAKNIRFDER